MKFDFFNKVSPAFVFINLNSFLELEISFVMLLEDFKSMLF